MAVDLRKRWVAITVATSILLVGGLATVWLFAFAPASFVRTSMSETLIDPESARVEITDWVHGSKGTVVCGNINARNRMGGYTGEKPFIMAYSGTPPFADVVGREIAGSGWSPGRYSRDYDEYFAEDAANLLRLCKEARTALAAVLGSEK